MALRHIALFRWREGTTAEQISRVGEALGALPEAIPELIDYSFGPDEGLSEGNFDFAVVADVADAAGYAVYRDHPDHQAALAVVRPLLAERVALQLEIPGIDRG
ncbi:Dabb family protein [Nocardiopsis alba]|uniref:Dabb family protein n=1 Tax=Nocardiopsis alba TaxID=53437 RepID=UPI00366EC9FA